MVEEIQDVQASKKVNVTPQNKDALLDKFNAQEAAKVETLEAAEAPCMYYETKKCIPWVRLFQGLYM